MDSQALAFHGSSGAHNAGYYHHLTGAEFGSNSEIAARDMHVTFNTDSPVVELKARPPVWCPQQSLQGTGKIDKHVAHQEKPEERKREERKRNTE